MRWLDADGKPQRRVPGAEAALSLQPRSRRRGCSRRAPTEFARGAGGRRRGHAAGLRAARHADAVGDDRPAPDRERERGRACCRAPIRNCKNEYVVLTAHLDHLGRGAAVERRLGLQRRARQRRRHRRCCWRSRARCTHRTRSRDARSCSPPSPPRRKGCSARTTSRSSAHGDGSDASSRTSTSTCRMTFAPVRDFVALGARAFDARARSRATRPPRRAIG